MPGTPCQKHGVLGFLRALRCTPLFSAPPQAAGSHNGTAMMRQAGARARAIRGFCPRRSLRLRAGPDEPTRSSPIAAVVLTNADVDHVAGLLTLRENQALALYAHSRVLDVL